jgi:hypothetical protein
MPPMTNLVYLFTGDGSDWVNTNWTEEELEAHYERKRCEARRKERVERAWSRVDLFETIQ